MEELRQVRMINDGIKKRIREKYHEKGISGIYRGIVRFIGLWFEKYIYSKIVYLFGVWDLTAPIPEIVSKIKLVVREIELRDMTLFTDLLPAKKFELFKERIENHITGMIALTDNGAIAGYVWVALKEEYLPGPDIIFRLQEDEGFLVDAYTFPDFRGKKINSVLINQGMKCMQHLGCKRGYGYLVSTNLASKKSLLNNGITFNKKVAIYKIFGLTLKKEHPIGRSGNS